MVMGIYEARPDGLGTTPAPPGTVLPPGLPGLEMFGSIVQALGLKEVGLYTPWAARESGVEWEEVDQPPDTNVVAFSVNQQALNAAQSVTFGQPLPFIAIITSGMPTPSQVESAFDLSPYTFYQTQAVYRQDDKAAVPRIYLMHWGEYRKPGDAMFNKGSIDQAAAKLAGASVYASQVDYKTTAQRTPPSQPFATVIGQAGPAPGPELPPPPPPAVPPPPSTGPKKTPPWLIIGALGVGAAAIAFIATRAIREK
jgi:hypothetical protein